MTMYLWLKLLAFGFAFLDITVFVAGNSTQLSTQEPSTRTPGGPLPARTTASSPANISKGGKDSSEISPPASPDSLTTKAPLTSWGNDSTTVTGAPGEGTTATLPAEPAAPPATSRSPALSSPAASPPLTSNSTTQDNASLPLTSNSTTQDKASPPLTSNPTTQDNTSDEQTTTPALTTASTVSPATAPSTIAPTNASKPSCGDKYRVVSVRYSFDNNDTFTATLNVTGEKCEPLGCEKQYPGLSACETKNINMSYPSCEPPLEYPLEVPPDPNWFQLKECVEDKEADTSLCLHWENKIFVNSELVKDCKETKITYEFKCDGLSPSNNTDTFKVTNLQPRTNYTCSSQVLYNQQLLISQNKIIETDFGEPEAPQNFSCSAKSATEGKCTWTRPQSYFDRVSLCYWITPGGPNCTPQDKTQDRIDLPHLTPFTNYTVVLQAWVTGRVNRSRRATHTFQTDPAKPSKVNGLSASRKTENIIAVSCKRPDQLNGPEGTFYLEVRTGNTLVKRESRSECRFLVEDLQYLTEYKFLVYYNNTKCAGHPESVTASTSYNAKALIIFLVFLIIVTSVALLIVLYKIYDLHKKRSSSY